MSSTATLIAHTQLSNIPAMESAGYKLHDPRAGGVYATDADELAEFAGRICYLSMNRPNPATGTNHSYLGHILDIGHTSILEHSSATFLINASRSVLTELERHRHLSFSVVSQRYVDATNLPFHVPPAIEDIEDLEKQVAAARIIERAAEQALYAYSDVVELLTEQVGLPRKKAREAARSVLPNGTDSPMVVTGNLRAWRHVIGMRFHEAADAEIRELMQEILPQLRELAPNTFQDIPSTPFSY